MPRGRPKGSKSLVRLHALAAGASRGNPDKPKTSRGGKVYEHEITDYTYRQVRRMHKEGCSIDQIVHTLQADESLVVSIIYRERKPNTTRCPNCKSLLTTPVHVQPCLTCVANASAAVSKTVGELVSPGETILLTPGKATLVPVTHLKPTRAILAAEVKVRKAATANSARNNKRQAMRDQEADRLLGISH